jgi:hypothetical protein
MTIRILDVFMCLIALCLLLVLAKLTWMVMQL